MAWKVALAIAQKGPEFLKRQNSLGTWFIVVTILALVLAFKWATTAPAVATNKNMSGQVVLITGGTSGIGAELARDFAKRGAQVTLLVRNLKDGWLAEYIESLRLETSNPLITAAEVDLESLHSVRVFATKWLDNLPPRRLDMICCTAGLARPPYSLRTSVEAGVEQQAMVNYLAHFHLLTLMAPALRNQPPDRDVRVILTTCLPNMMKPVDPTQVLVSEPGSYSPFKAYLQAKLAISMFAIEYQKRTLEYVRKDQAPSNVKTVLVNPGLMRSLSFRNFVSCGTIKGLVVYLFVWPVIWLFTGSAANGAKSGLRAATENLMFTKDCVYIENAQVSELPRVLAEQDPNLRKQLYEETVKFVEIAEKTAASERNRQKAKATPEKST